MKLVLASNNAKKLAELAALFAPLDIALVRQGELGVVEAEEPHPTFIENALAKARHAAAMTGLPALADDSGLCVEALGGAPGVVSANFAPLVQDAAAPRESQRAEQDAANNRLLLERLAGHAGRAERRAWFVCTLVALRSPDDPQPLVAVGRWQGEILGEAQGAGGFGYDPLMWIPALERSVASLDPQTKNTHSHRALAARRMCALMHEVWRQGRG